MGLSLADFQAGAASVSSVIGSAADAWSKISGKTSVSTGGIQATQPATPSAPATPNQAVNQGAASGMGGLAAIPPWALLGGGVLVLWALSKRR